MSVAVDEIRLVVKTELEKAFSDMRKFQDEAKKSGKEGGTFLDGFKGGLKSLEGPVGKMPMAIGKIGGAIVGVATALAGLTFAAIKLSDAASKEEQSLKKLEAVSKATSVSFDGAKKAAQELSSDGLMTFQESAQALSNLLASGLSLPKAIDLLRVAKDNAVTNRQAHLELGESVVTFTEGIRNQNSMLTDSVGITKNYALILEEGAKALGVTSEQLTKEQQAQIVANGFIKEGSVFLGQAAKSSETYAGAKAKAEAAVKNFVIAVGSQLSPVMTELFKIFTSVTGKVGEFVPIAGSVAEILVRTIWAAFNAVLGLYNLAVSPVRAFAVGLFEILKELDGVIQKTVTGNFKGATEALKNILPSADRAFFKTFESVWAESKMFVGNIVDQWKGAKEEVDKIFSTVKTLGNPAPTVQGPQNQKIDTSNPNIDRNLLEAKKLDKEITEDKIKNREEVLKKAIEFGYIAFHTEKDEKERIALLSKELSKVEISELGKRVKKEEEARAEKDRLVKEGLALHLGSEAELTRLTLEEIKKRVEGYKTLKEVLKQIFSGAKDLLSGIFDFEKQEREQNLAASLGVLQSEYDKKIELLEKSNEYTQEVSDFEKALKTERDEATAADLQSELDSINQKLQGRIGRDEKEKLLDQKKKIEKEILENQEQKRLDELKEKEKKRTDEINEEKKKAETEFQKASKALKKEAFDKDKESKIAQAIINGALAITMAFATLGPIGGAISAAFLAATTGFQIATIASQKFPEYRSGIDYVPSDRIAMLHEGERVLTKEENRSFATHMGGITLNFYGHQDPQAVYDIFDEQMKTYGNLVPG